MLPSGAVRRNGERGLMDWKCEIALAVQRPFFGADCEGRLVGFVCRLGWCGHKLDALSAIAAVYPSIASSKTCGVLERPRENQTCGVLAFLQLYVVRERVPRVEVCTAVKKYSNDTNRREESGVEGLGGPEGLVLQAK